MNKFILILFLFLFASCNKLTTGMVVKKEFEPERHYTQLMPLRINNMTIMMPYMVTDNEDYILYVEGDYEGEKRYEKVYVSKACYNSLQEGDTWNITTDCSFTDDNNTRVKKDE